MKNIHEENIEARIKEIAVKCVPDYPNIEIIGPYEQLTRFCKETRYVRHAKQPLSRSASEPGPTTAAATTAAPAGPFPLAALFRAPFSPGCILLVHQWYRCRI